MGYIISGIQQVGVGVTDVKIAFKWYRKNFGMNIRIFEDASIADLMLPYTGGEPRERHAILALNMRGGGGFEIWQHKGKTPEFIKDEIQLGDYGIHIAKMKTSDIEKSWHTFKQTGLELQSDILTDPTGRKHFFVKDLYGNIFQFVEESNVFKKVRLFNNGGTYGVIIGVSDVDKSLTVYKEILGYDKIVYDQTDSFTDLQMINGGKGRFRRILLKHSKPRTGSFSPLLGPSEIELIQAVDNKHKAIYEDRMWGDPGFIHLCFDIKLMDELRETCTTKGHAFTVDSSNSFDMGEAAGHFSYIEDPDGTLIEFVETYKIPVVKKMGWYVKLNKRKPEKPLPDWMLKSLKYNQVK